MKINSERLCLERLKAHFFGVRSYLAVEQYNQHMGSLANGELSLEAELPSSTVTRHDVEMGRFVSYMDTDIKMGRFLSFMWTPTFKWGGFCHLCGRRRLNGEVSVIYVDADV